MSEGLGKDSIEIKYIANSRVQKKKNPQNMVVDWVLVIRNMFALVDLKYNA
jgi:hypothetical protein